MDYLLSFLFRDFLFWFPFRVFKNLVYFCGKPGEVFRARERRRRRRRLSRRKRERWAFQVKDGEGGIGFFGGEFF